MKRDFILIASIGILIYLIGFFTASLLFADNTGNGLGELFNVKLDFEKLESQNPLSANVNIVAVTRQGTGALNKGEAEIKPGKGRVLITTNPFVEPDTQYSLELAKRIAEEFTRKSLAEWDVIYSVTETQAVLVGGPSAGAAFTLATIAAVEGSSLREDSTITGSIEKGGKIGQIGGVVEKLIAFGEAGGKLFLIPEGQRVITYYSEVPETYTRWNVVIQRIKIIPKQIDLAKFAEEQFGMEVKEVGNIKEAYELMKSP